MAAWHLAVPSANPLPSPFTRKFPEQEVRMGQQRYTVFLWPVVKNISSETRIISTVVLNEKKLLLKLCREFSFSIRLWYATVYAWHRWKLNDDLKKKKKKIQSAQDPQTGMYLKESVVLSGQLSSSIVNLLLDMAPAVTLTVTTVNM